MSRDRAALRREFREVRRAIPAADRIAAAERLASQLSSLPFMPQRGHVAGYWAMDAEIALHVWQLRLPRALTYCLPVLHEEGCLRFAPWRPGDPLVTNRYGIPEPDIAAELLITPENMSVVVLPLVAFDVHGQRLGMGAGWYDRSFAFRGEREAPPFLVGAAFAAQQSETLAVEPWDVPLDAVCTELDTFLPIRKT
jgi:5-formyltetrahydrofolate cyclo-ligase